MGNDSPNNNKENNDSTPNKKIKSKNKDRKNIHRTEIIGTKNNIKNESSNNNDINELIQDFYNFRDSAIEFSKKINQEICAIKEDQNKIREEVTIIRQILEKNNSKKEIKNISEGNLNSIEKKENIEEKEKGINNINNINIEKEDFKEKKISENLEENKNNIEKIKANLKSNNKYKFIYLIINDELENDLIRILKDSIIKKEYKLNPNNVFERQEIQSENQNIYSRIKKHLSSYAKEKQDRMLKKAQFLKNIGFLVRFSHEVANFMHKILLDIFKEQVGFHSINNETIRLYYASWIIKVFNMTCFLKIVKIPYILAQIDVLNLEENVIFKEIFPLLIKLYFLCYLTDIKVEVIYAEEDIDFDLEIMTDDLLSVDNNEKKVLFTFLPGLYCNNQYFENAQIHTVTYKIDNPNKFQFKKPIFSNIETSFTLNLNPEIKFYYEKKKINNENYVKFEIITNPEIKWDNPTYEIIFLDSKNFTYPIINNTYIIGFDAMYYGKCLCKIKYNNLEFKSEPIILDLTKDTNKK